MLVAVMLRVPPLGSATVAWGKRGLPIMYVLEPVSGYMPSAAHTNHALMVLSRKEVRKWIND